MRSKLTIVILVLILSDPTSSQILTSSNLPIIIINIDGGSSIDYFSRIWGSMKVIYRGEGQRTLISDQYNAAYLNYDGRINIKIRGNSTLLVDKSQYGFTTLKADNNTNNNVSLLGMPPENDWILNGMAYDPALIRDYLTYNLSRQIGEYAPRAVYCELIINGDYRGLYLLTEKIKADDNRVNVIKITPSDVILPTLTGGYITLAEEGCGADALGWKMTSYGGQTVSYCHELPKSDEVISAQEEYIHSQFISLETTASADNASIRDGFPSIIDIPSFIHFIIINELASNPDAYWGSTYFHKDRNGKLRAGPIWDFDLAYGNYNARSFTYLWQFSGCDYISYSDNGGSTFWKDLFDNPQFRCYLSKRWNELIQPGQPLNLLSIEAFIDQNIITISEAIVRDNVRWGIANHQQQIDNIKTFLDERIQWMTANFGSFSSCINVPIPPLVITKIMYHPEASIYSSDNDDLEFVEITNNSDKTVDLTGVYFGETGFVYQFPVNSTLGPYKSIFLTSNSLYFELKYGFIPFGQFTRHLSNKSENLILLDAFGNMIDNINYSDSPPWPNADGNGYYLMLTDVNFDNSLAGNWTISKDLLLTKNDFYLEVDPQLSPNPVYRIGKFTYQSGKTVSIEIYNVSGLLLKIIADQDHDGETDIDFSDFTSGVYLYRLITEDMKVYVGKLIKE